MFDFTVCEQQNLANSLFVETLELEKYLKKIGTLTKRGPRPPPPPNPPLSRVSDHFTINNGRGAIMFSYFLYYILRSTLGILVEPRDSPLYSRHVV